MVLRYLFFQDGDQLLSRLSRNLCQNRLHYVNSQEQGEIKGHFSQQSLLKKLVQDQAHYLPLEIDHYSHLHFVDCFSAQSDVIFRNKI